VSDTKNVKIGVCNAFFNNQDLGYTKGGVEVTVSTETHPVNVDQFGKTAINEYIMGRTLKVKVPLAETTLDNLVRTMPGSTLVTDGAFATGTLTIATNLTAGQTVVIGGKTLTARATQATVVGNLDFVVGATAAATAAVIAAMIDSSTDPVLASLNASVAGAVITISAAVRGTAGNAITLSSGTAGASATVSGATLTGGINTTKARVDVTTGTGVDLLSVAKTLRLHPKGKLDTDLSEDFVVPLAATPGALTFAYQLENERIFNVEFTGYPDPTTDKLFYVGDPSAV
jgi:hypothetical protein